MAIFLLVHLYVILVFFFSLESKCEFFFFSGASENSKFTTLPFLAADKMVI